MINRRKSSSQSNDIPAGAYKCNEREVTYDKTNAGEFFPMWVG
jgi:hypothetical protein